MEYVDFETAQKLNWKGKAQKSYIFKSGYTKIDLISSKLAEKEQGLEQGVNIVPAPSFNELIKFLLNKEKKNENKRRLRRIQGIG